MRKSELEIIKCYYLIQHILADIICAKKEITISASTQHAHVVTASLI